VKITTTTIELDDNHPAVLAAVERRAAELVPDPEPEEEGHFCGQCDEPLTKDRISPVDQSMDEPMCRDCELEYVNPRQWFREHPEARR
jgi:hypothetical protein